VNQSTQHQPDPALDLVMERTVDIPRELVWKAWTTPELLKQWFTPSPWRTTECDIDLRPGGIFRTVMQGPDGERTEGVGCFLEIVENEKLVWTSALGAGYRPQVVGELQGCHRLVFTAVITMEPAGNGTKYTALVIHGDEASSKEHAEMGFQDGWGTAFDQLVEMVKKDLATA
jgi:uncharacterized protein YndB with AHSA1/START domain